MLPTREEAKALIRRALGFSRASEMRAVLSGRRGSNVRFALGGITSCGEVEDLALTVVSTLGRRRAAVGTNLLDDAGIESAVRGSEDLARLLPEDPEYVPEEGPRQSPEVPAWFAETAAVSADRRAEAAAKAIAVGRASGGVTSGFFEAEETIAAVGTSRGFLAAHAATEASFSVSVRTREGTGSGWAGRNEPRIGAIDPEAVARAAGEKAALSAKPAPLGPGAHTVVLEPDAVADLIPFLLFSLDARLAAEGRSFFSKPGGGSRIGERLFGSNVTLVSDPSDPMLLTAPFSEEGIARTRRTWIQAGVLADLSYSRYWAARHGGRPSGGIAGAILLGGTTTLEEMIGSTERGLLVTRFHYVNMVDPRSILLTGLTRDGTFLIEKGEIQGPVNNFRFNQSLPEMLRSIEALGVPRRTLGRPVMAAPPVKVGSFVFTSVAAGV